MQIALKIRNLDKGWYFEMACKWVQAKVTGEIREDGSIVATTSDYKGMDTPRPRDFDESGADRTVFARFWRYQSTGEFEQGSFETIGFMGGATAIMVETAKLELLPENLMKKLDNKYCPMGSLMYLAEVRNTGAPTIWNVAEPSGGMAEDFNLAAEQMGETVELGFYQDDGWVRFILPVELAGYQNQLDREQSLWWNVIRPDFPQHYEAPLRFLPIGSDNLDGRHGIIVAGPVGDLTHLAVAQLDLPGNGWKVLDTESRPGNPNKGESEWVSLNRKIVGITRRQYSSEETGQWAKLAPDYSPLLWEFAPDGGLDHCGLHMALSGEAVEYNISHLSKVLLGRRGLNWLK